VIEGKWYKCGAIRRQIRVMWGQKIWSQSHNHLFVNFDIIMKPFFTLKITHFSQDREKKGGKTKILSLQLLTW